MGRWMTHAAAALYWQAFGAKLGRLLGPPDRGRAVIARALDPAFALSAVAPDGRLLGVAGFNTAAGAFVDLDFAHLRLTFGLTGALCRAPVLAITERPIEAGRLLMDGICVHGAPSGSRAPTRSRALSSGRAPSRCHSWPRGRAPTRSRAPSWTVRHRGVVRGRGAMRPTQSHARSRRSTRSRRSARSRNLAAARSRAPDAEPCAVAARCAGR
ncbi:MAG: N-acetyltransferase [Myxococcales bacterium]|nr:N-acetyltransferase [Myxococcales bacterium]